MVDTLDPGTAKDFAVQLEKFSAAVELVVLEFSLVNLTSCEGVLANSVLLVLLPLSFVEPAILISAHALARFLVV